MEKFLPYLMTVLELHLGTLLGENDKKNIQLIIQLKLSNWKHAFS